MTEYLLHFKISNHNLEHHVWISSSYIVEDFMKEIESFWEIEGYELFGLETKSFLDQKKSWFENQIVSGDHILVI